MHSYITVSLSVVVIDGKSFSVDCNQKYKAAVTVSRYGSNIQKS